MTRKHMITHGTSEKADYLQIGGCSIDIYSKNERLFLGAGVLTIGGSQTFLSYIGGGGGMVKIFFPAGLGGWVVKYFVHHMKM